MTNRGQFPQLLAAGMMVGGFDQLDPHTEEYSTFLKVDTSTAAYEQSQKLAGLGQVRRKEEGAPIGYDDPIEGGSTRYIHETYALGFSCTMEMLADDQYGKIKQVPKELTPSMRYQVEQTSANLLNNGFTTTKAHDGVSLFNSAHPLLGGGTQTNVHASNADLSATALQDMTIIADNWVNDRGFKRAIKATDIWYPAELQWIAKKILKGEFEVGTGNNDLNVVQGLYNPHLLHYLTSTTAWFLSTKGHNGLKLWWRQKPTMDAADDFDTKGTKHSVVARFIAGAEDYVGWLGSTGLGS